MEKVTDDDGGGDFLTKRSRIKPCGGNEAAQGQSEDNVWGSRFVQPL